jgi:speckle-type POZ protein
MESETISTPQMIVSYEWSFESVEKQTTRTIASKMISFRGNRVFRVGVKNHAQSAVLFFMAVDFSKTGMKVKDVKVHDGLDVVDPAIMTQMVEENIGDGGSLQLFTINFVTRIVDENRTLIDTNRTLLLVFRICIEGTDPGYSYQLSDRLAKDQLWAALKNQLHLADVEFVLTDKSFPAHKAILAARSYVFADEFEKKQPGRNGPHQINIDGVEPSTCVNFLHFIYTGEPKGTLADEDLRKLADRYGLTTLSSLCKHALKKMDAMQMENLRKCLNSNTEELSSSKIM